MKKIMFCGGGSAGHVMPNIAIIEQLKEKYEVCYLGTPAIEKDICTSRNIAFYQFDGVKLVRGKVLCNLCIPFKLYKSIRQCTKILQNTKPDLLFCKGGYVSLPPAFAASKLGIPMITHESDLSLGLANKVIAHKCDKVLTAFPSTAKGKKKGVFVGTPMRTSLFNRDKLFAKAHFDLDLRPTIIVFGGGSGSTIINYYVREIASKICKDYNILHICGKGNVVFSNIYGYKQVEFIDDMGLVYACADYAVARCGANSANELIALKVPTLFIPLENKRSRGDQVANAQYFYNQGLCHVLSEKQLNQQSLLDAIKGLICDDKIKTSLELSQYKRGNENIIYQIQDILK